MANLGEGHCWIMPTTGYAASSGAALSHIFTPQTASPTRAQRCLFGPSLSVLPPYSLSRSRPLRTFLPPRVLLFFSRFPLSCYFVCKRPFSFLAHTTPTPTFASWNLSRRSPFPSPHDPGEGKEADFKLAAGTDLLMQLAGRGPQSHAQYIAPGEVWDGGLQRDGSMLS